MRRARPSTERRGRLRARPGRPGGREAIGRLVVGAAGPAPAGRRPGASRPAAAVRRRSPRGAAAWRAGGSLHPSGVSHCLVCGPEHPTGFRVRFRRAGDRITTSFTPRRRHQGFHGLMSGGLLAAIFDCLQYRVSVALGSPSTVTARVEVNYRLPIGLGRRLRFEARLLSRRGRVFESEAVALLPDGRVAADSRATYVEVPPERLPGAARGGRG